MAAQAQGSTAWMEEDLDRAGGPAVAIAAAPEVLHRRSEWEGD